MDQNDYPRFKRLLSRLCETLGKPVSEELIETWWKALRTSAFAEIEQRVDEYLARADERTRFPRPGQLRPQEDPTPGQETRNWVRDFWRTQLVWELQRELCIERQVVSHVDLEEYIARNGAEFTHLRMTLDQLEDLEARNQGQRTPGMFHLARDKARAAVSQHLAPKARAHAVSPA